MNAVRHHSPFRKYARSNSWTGVAFVAALAVFDLACFVFIIYRLVGGR